MGARIRLLILVVLASLGAVAGIRANKQAQQALLEPLPPAALPPVAAPTGLVAEAVIASPDATWRKAQLAIGGVVVLAPPTFGGILAAMTHVPDLAAVVDGAAPAYAAVDDRWRWVIAAHAVSASRAKTTAEANPTNVGASGSWILVGSDASAVTDLGPYASRTLPTRALPKAAVFANAGSAAIAGPLRAELDRRWTKLRTFLLDKDDEARRDHNGRAPDLADPKPLVAAADAWVAKVLANAGGMQSAELALDVVDDDSIDARVTLTPPHDGATKAWVDSLEGGSTTVLVGTSADAIGTIFWRSTPPEREATAKDFGDLLGTMLGTRVPAADEAKLGELLGAVAKARAGWAIASFAAGAAPGGFVRLSTNDSKGMTTALEGIADLARKPAWASWEKTFGVTKLDRTGAHATVTTNGGPTIQATWVAREGETDLGVGLDAQSLVTPVDHTHAIGADPKVSSWLRAVGGNVMVAIIARPLLVASSPRTDAALVAFTKQRDNVEVRARTTGVLVRQAVVSSGKL